MNIGGLYRLAWLPLSATLAFVTACDERDAEREGGSRDERADAERPGPVDPLDGGDAALDANDGSDAPQPWTACEDRRGQYLCVGEDRMRCDEDGVLTSAPCPDGLPCRAVQDQVFCAVDVDECALQLDNCSAPATCINTLDSFECSCPLGFMSDRGSGCYEIAECADIGWSSKNPCGEGGQRCTNTEGSYRCDCGSGFTGTGSTACVDIDECAQDVCGVGARCINSPGDFSCLCDEGYLYNRPYFPKPVGCHLRAWQAPVAVSDRQGDAAWPAVAVGAPSSGFADESYSTRTRFVWEQRAGTLPEVWDNYATLRVPVEQVRLLDGHGAGATRPAAAANYSNFPVAWRHFDGARWEVWGGSGIPRRLSSDAEGGADASHVRVGAGGESQLISWQVAEGAAATVWASAARTGDQGGKVQKLGDGVGPTVSDPDDQGHGRALWTTVASPPSIVSRKYHNSPVDGWLALELVSDDTSGDEPHIALAADGNGLITWRGAEPLRLPMARFTTTRRPPYSFGDVTPLDTRPARSAPQVAMRWGSVGLAVWVGDGDAVRASTFAESTGYSPAIDVDSPSEGTVSGLSAGMDGQGAAVVVWSRHVAGRSTIWAAHYVDGSWLAPMALATSDLADPMLALDMNGLGRAAVVWVARDDGVARVWSRAFE